HCLYYRYRARHYAWIMTAFTGYFGCISGAINGRLALHNGGYRFKSHLKFNRHPIAHAALYAAREIGERFYRRRSLPFRGRVRDGAKYIVMLRAAHFAAGETRAVFKPVDGVNAQHGFAEVGMQLIKNGLAKTCRTIGDIAAYFSANRITLLADAIDMADHFFGCRPVGTAHDVFLAFVNKLLRVAEFYMGSVDGTNAAYMRHDLDALCF